MFANNNQRKLAISTAPCAKRPPNSIVLGCWIVALVELQFARVKWDAYFRTSRLPSHLDLIPRAFGLSAARGAARHRSYNGKARSRNSEPNLKCGNRRGPFQEVISPTSSSNQLLRKVYLITGFLVQRTGILILNTCLLNYKSPPCTLTLFRRGPRRRV